MKKKKDTMIFSVEKINKELTSLLEEAFKAGYLQGLKEATELSDNLSQTKGGTDENI